MIGHMTRQKIRYSGPRILWQYGLSSFQAGGVKLEKLLPTNQHTQRKLFNFENWCNGEVSKIGHDFIK